MPVGVQPQPDQRLAVPGGVVEGIVDRDDELVDAVSRAATGPQRFGHCLPKRRRRTIVNFVQNRGGLSMGSGVSMGASPVSSSADSR